MKQSDRQKLFVVEANKRFGATKNTRVNKLFGVSNSAKIIEGGIQVGVPNLDKAGTSDDGYILHCVIRFPPEDEVYFSILIRSDSKNMLSRLETMKELGSKASEEESSDKADPETLSLTEEEPSKIEKQIKYSKRNNLVATYIAHNGKIYLRNAGFWDSLRFDLSEVDPGISPDNIVVGLYPPAASARRSLLAREFVGYLGSLIGHDRVHEIQVWPDESAVHESMRRLPPSIPISEIEDNVSKMGAFYPGGEVSRFHAALNFLADKHFVILSGLSGTGKTQLAIRYARAVHGLTDQTAGDPFLFVCPVRPEWTDPTGLTGYYDVLSDRYMVPPFLEAVMVATAHRDSPVFVVLDEMNLAPVEYYLSDVLSCIETGEMLQLHSNSVPLEGSTGSTIRAQMPLPPNLYLIGTINIDETTNPISDKVLDRAIVIDMSAVELKGFLEQLDQQDPALADARAACEARLVAVYELMAQHGLGFGYRVAEEVVRYHAFTREHITALTPDQTTDDLMVQKVLVKLRGGERQRTLLTGLRTALDGLPRSQAFIDRLIADLDEFGSFQASR